MLRFLTESRKNTAKKQLTLAALCEQQLPWLRLQQPQHQVVFANQLQVPRKGASLAKMAFARLVREKQCYNLQETIMSC